MKILQLLPNDQRWRATIARHTKEGTPVTNEPMNFHVVCWALVSNEETGTSSVRGMIAKPFDQTELVFADEEPNFAGYSIENAARPGLKSHDLVQRLVKQYEESQATEISGSINKAP